MHTPSHDELRSLIADFKSCLTERFDFEERVEGKKKVITKLIAKPAAPLPPPVKKEVTAIKAQTPPPPPLPKKPEPIKTFVPEKTEEKNNSSLNDVRHFYQMEAPHKLAPLPEELKGPIEPKKGAVIFLAFSSPHVAFLLTVAKACETRLGVFCEVQLVDEKYRWEDKHYKLVLASEYGLEGFDNLRSQLKDGHKPTFRKLGNTPLIPLPDISLYLKEPKQKASLWALLCQELPKLSST